METQQSSELVKQLKQALVDKEVELREIKQTYFEVKRSLDDLSIEKMRTHDGLQKEI